MKAGKRHSSVTEDKKCADKAKPGQQEKRTRDGKETNQAKRRANRPSLIPVPKGEKTECKCAHHRGRKSSSSSKLTCLPCKTQKRYEDFENKLRLLEEKEKSIAQYYLRVEDLIRKLAESEQKENGKSLNRKTSRSSEARKMTSDPLVFSKQKTNNDILSDLENNVQQISKIWLQASTDLSTTLRNLKSNPSLDPMEFELERVRIQLAIKQTKSLTLVKTRDILAEARKLFRHREMIRMELENIVNSERLKQEKCECIREESSRSLAEREINTNAEGENKQKIDGTGDTPKESDLESQTVSTISNEDNEREREATSGTEEECLSKTTNIPEDSCYEEKEKSSERGSDESKNSHNMEAWAKEMSKKNETIANLNNKIFELQKACNEKSHKCSQLQIALSQFSDKIQWNHVLWKQIGKLKEQIKGLQQSNKQLESQKREMECKITKLDLELDRLLKLNHYLNQKKYLLNAQESNGKGGQNCDCNNKEELSKAKNEKIDKEMERKIDEKIIAEKQSAINQLKTILNVMRSQENFAQRQISLFQNKIQELEKNTKA